MKIKLESNIIPVLGWSDISECNCYKHLSQDINDGEDIIYNTIRELEDGGLCAYIFYQDYSVRTLYSVYIGRSHFIGRHPNHSVNNGCLILHLRGWYSPTKSHHSSNYN